MKNKLLYSMAAMLAVGVFGTFAQSANADDGYYAVLSAPCAIPAKTNTAATPMILKSTTSYPVVIEKTTTLPVVIENPNAVIDTSLGVFTMPPVLEKTSKAKPHHFFSFGVVLN